MNWRSTQRDSELLRQRQQIRAVPLDEEQFHFIEDLGLAHMRAGQHETATKLLAIALAWKVAPEIRGGTTGTPSGRTPHLPGGVAPSPRDATAASDGEHPQPSAPNVFRCTIDESAGLAEVVELQGYSRKVPCL